MKKHLKHQAQLLHAIQDVVVYAKMERDILANAAMEH